MLFLQYLSSNCIFCSTDWVEVKAELDNFCKEAGVNILHNHGKLFPDGVFSWDKLFPRIMRKSRHFLKLNICYLALIQPYNLVLPLFKKGGQENQH